MLHEGAASSSETNVAALTEATSSIRPCAGSGRSYDISDEADDWDMSAND